VYKELPYTMKCIRSCHTQWSV